MRLRLRNCTGIPIEDNDSMPGLAQAGHHIQTHFS
jgi:hypothetical protein